jgi:hypothetical protein
MVEVLPYWDVEDKVKHYQSHHSYRETALRTLTQFACDVRTRMSKLKKLVFLCKIPWTWVMEDAVPLEFHFEQLRLMFNKQDIDFQVNCDEVSEPQTREVIPGRC